MSILDCRDLVETGLEIDFRLDGLGGENCEIRTIPHQILEHPETKVVLYAQSLGETDVVVNMRLPRIRAFLRALTENGLGYSDEHDGVKYKFVSST